MIHFLHQNHAEFCSNIVLAGAFIHAVVCYSFISKVTFLKKYFYYLNKIM